VYVRALQLLLWPLWLVQVFSTAKSFQENPLLGSPRLNRLGLHVWRVRTAHRIAAFKWRLLSPLADPALRREYEANGFLVIRDYLEPAHFEALRRELRSCREPLRECIQGDTLTLRVLLDGAALKGLPACRALAQRQDFTRILQYCAGTLRRPMLFIQCIKNEYAKGGSDPQKSLHSDTFHPTMKAWLFVDDVDERNGPFTFVPGSHLPSEGRLEWERQQSLSAADRSDRYSAKGSLRLDPGGLAAMGLPPPVSLKVPANTLVVANTHGFHCRGQASGKSSRLEIYASSRTNPFNPFPGIGSKVLSRAEYAIAQAYWSVMDRLAARRGTISSWHPVPSDKLHQ
jgi:hypothetical protein